MASIAPAFLIVAVILFCLAVFIPEHGGRLLPAGLAFFAASFLV